MLQRTEGRRRILFLTCHLPWPAISGGRRRELELLRRLARRFDVHLVVVSKTIAQDRQNVAAMRGICAEVDIFPALRGHSSPGQPLPVIRHRCPEAARRVAEIVDRSAADLVHVEGFYLMQHVPQPAGLPVVLAEQNIEYELERQRDAICSETMGPDHRLRWARTRRMEIDCWRRADALAAVTVEDQDAMLRALPGRQVDVVPDGVDHVHPRRPGELSHRLPRPAEPLLMFVANFAYAPNVDAALHLHRDILPRIRRRIPTAHLWLVGNAPPPEVRALQGERVRVTGRVDDVTPYLDSADVLLCPLRIGGGIKVKAIESLRRAKALVSTSVGAQGLPPTARQGVEVADEPAGFARAVARLATDEHARARLEVAAAEAAGWLPGWDAAASALAEVYDRLLDAAARQREELVAAGGAR